MSTTQGNDLNVCDVTIDERGNLYVVTEVKVNGAICLRNFVDGVPVRDQLMVPSHRSFTVVDHLNITPDELRAMP